MTFKKIKYPFAIVIVVPDWLWDKLHLGNFIGRVITIFVFVKKSQVSKCLIVHELVHIEQFRRHIILQPFRYLTNQERRLRYEAEAYAKELLFILSVNHEIDYFDNIKDLKTYRKLLDKHTLIIHRCYKITDYDIKYIRDMLEIFVKKAILEYNENELRGLYTFYKEDTGSLGYVTDVKKRKKQEV